jgi:hypothetical protein
VHGRGQGPGDEGDVGEMRRALTRRLREGEEEIPLTQRLPEGEEETHPYPNLPKGERQIPSSGVSQNEKVIKENLGVSDLWTFRVIRLRRQLKSPSLMRRAAFCDRSAGHARTHSARRECPLFSAKA